MLESLELYGALIDAAGDAQDQDALVRATEIHSAVEAGCSGWHVSWARYCLSNAWAELYRLRRYPHQALSWQQPELRSQIFQLRSALQHEAIEEMDPVNGQGELAHLAKFPLHQETIYLERVEQLRRAPQPA